MPDSVVLLPQEAQLTGRWRVEDFVTYVASLRGVPRNVRQKNVELALKRFGLHDKRTARTSTLSGGWRQRVLIAQCFTSDCDTIALDEPTSSLDVAAAREIWGLLLEASRETPIVVATHDAGAALEFADRVVPIRDGRVGEPFEGAKLRTSHAESRLSPGAFLLEVLST